MHIMQVNDPGFLCKLHEQLAKLRSQLQLTEDWTEDSPDYQVRPAASARLLWYDAQVFCTWFLLVPLLRVP